MNQISDKTIEHICILAQLDLSKEEKLQTKADMGQMLGFMEKIKEADTTGVEPLTHLFPASQELREDEVTNSDGSQGTIANAPNLKNGMFQVPKTVGNK